jgi:arylsulfatase
LPRRVTLHVRQQRAVAEGQGATQGRFACNGGGGFGKGAAVTMRVNDTKVTEGQLPKTIPIQISLGKGLHIGMDVGWAVDCTYKVPFQFIGRFEKVTVY